MDFFRTWLKPICFGALILTASLSIIASGCGGGGGDSDDADPDNGESAVYRQFAYVTNRDDNSISIYTVDDINGGRLCGKGQVIAGAAPYSVTVDPSGKFAYAANYLTNNISAYTIDAGTGGLREVGGSPFAAGTVPACVTVDPSGKFAYVANFETDNISAYTIDAVTGALTELTGSPFAAGDGPRSITVDPLGKFAYVANDKSQDVSAYAIDPATGVLTEVAGSPFTAGEDACSVTIDPLGRFAYVANEASNDISAYAIDPAAGALTEVPGSPFPAGDDPYSITVDPSGKFAYVANRRDYTVSAYAIDPNTGALTEVPGSPFPAGDGPCAVDVDSSGKFAYVTNMRDHTVSAYAIDPATGALREVEGSPFATGQTPVSITLTQMTEWVLPTDPLVYGQELLANCKTPTEVASMIQDKFYLGAEDVIAVLRDLTCTNQQLCDAARDGLLLTSGTEIEEMLAAAGVPEDTYCRDFDGDGYGDTIHGNISTICPPPGYVLDNTDCDDSNERINPESSEILNGIDDDCDGAIDEDHLFAYVYRFAPILKFNQPASTFPMDAQWWFEEQLCNGQNKDGHYLGEVEYQIACRKHPSGWPLTGNVNYYIHNNQLYRDLMQTIPVPTYYKVNRCGSGGQLRIEYWWFYGYQSNALLDLGIQDHPADWEHIIVITSEDRREIAAITFFQHSGHHTRIYGAPPPGWVEEDHGNPVVYIGKTAHGSYFNRSAFLGTWGTAFYWDDNRDPGPNTTWYTWRTPLLNLDENSQTWMSFDRTRRFYWGINDGEGCVGTHPTVRHDSDICGYSACDGVNPFGTNGCWGSDCQTGDCDCGYYCSSSTWGCIFWYDIYSKDWRIPTVDDGIISNN